MRSILRYTLTLSNWRAHQFDVVLQIPKHNTSSLVLSLPSWIPGSYMVRDFAKNLVEMSAQLNDDDVNTPGAMLFVEKLDKQSWRIETGGKPCTLNYTVYANDLSIR